MHRVLITGANGFLGRYLSKALCNVGWEVHGTVRKDFCHQDHDYMDRAWPLDLACVEEVRDTVATVAPSYVVHLAAISNVMHSSVREIYETNILGTRNLLEALRPLASTLRSVLLASSGNIYGNSTEGILDESAHPAPANDYGVSKIAAEYLARTYGQEIPLIIARPFNYTGVGQALDFVIPKIIDHAIRRASFIELGNLNVARDFSDVRDTCEAYCRLLATPRAIGKTVNVASGTAIPLGEVLAIVREVTGHELAVKVNPAFVRPNEVRHLCGSRQLLDMLIGTFKRHSILDTIQWMSGGNADRVGV